MWDLQNHVFQCLALSAQCPWMIDNEAGLGFEPFVCDSESHCFSIIMGWEAMEVEIYEQHVLHATIYGNHRNNSKAPYLKLTGLCTIKICNKEKKEIIWVQIRKVQNIDENPISQNTHTHIHVITPHKLSFLSQRISWHMCTRFLSGPGGEAYILCTQMGALTRIGAVCADLPANTEVPGRPLPDTLLTSSFTGREAAANNSIETEWDHAALESHSADWLPLEGTFFPRQPPFFGYLSCKMPHCKESLLP